MNIKIGNIKRYFQAIKFVAKEHFKKLTLLLTFFILIITISNLTLSLYNFKLIPFVEIAFNTFRKFYHYLLNLLVFSWMSYVLELFWYSIQLIASFFLPIMPKWYKITFPELISDLALVSLALTRSFYSTDLIIPRKARENAESKMNKIDWLKIEYAEGPFWYFIHQRVEKINNTIWRIVNFLTRILTLPFRKNSKLTTYIESFVIAIAGSVFMWGFFRFIGYSINILRAGNLQVPIMKVRKLFFKYYIIILLGAIFATVLFLLFNGFIAEWLKPK